MTGCSGQPGKDGMNGQSGPQGLPGEDMASLVFSATQFGFHDGPDVQLTMADHLVGSAGDGSATTPLAAVFVGRKYALPALGAAAPTPTDAYSRGAFEVGDAPPVEALAYTIASADAGKSVRAIVEATRPAVAVAASDGSAAAHARSA